MKRIAVVKLLGYDLMRWIFVDHFLSHRDTVSNEIGGMFGTCLKVKSNGELNQRAP